MGKSGIHPDVNSPLPFRHPLPNARGRGFGETSICSLNLTQRGLGGILRKRMQKCEYRLLGFGGRRGRMKISKGNRHGGKIKEKPGTSFQLSFPSERNLMGCKLEKNSVEFSQ